MRAELLSKCNLKRAQMQKRMRLQSFIKVDKNLTLLTKWSIQNNLDKEALGYICHHNIEQRAS